MNWIRKKKFWKKLGCREEEKIFFFFSFLHASCLEREKDPRVYFCDPSKNFFHSLGATVETQQGEKVSCQTKCSRRGNSGSRCVDRLNAHGILYNWCAARVPLSLSTLLSSYHENRLFSNTLIQTFSTVIRISHTWNMRELFHTISEVPFEVQESTRTKQRVSIPRCRSIRTLINNVERNFKKLTFTRIYQNRGRINWTFFLLN